MANQQNQNSGSIFSFRAIPAILMLVVAFIALYYFVKVSLFMLAVASPIMLLITLIVDHTVVTNFGKWLVNLVSKNWLNSLYLIGFLMVLYFVLGLNVFVYGLLPAVSTFLLGKALLKKKVKSVKEEMDNRVNGEYVEYEEVQTESTAGADDIGFEEIEEMELEDLDDLTPPKMKQKETRPNTDYDEYFE